MPARHCVVWLTCVNPLHLSTTTFYERRHPLRFPGCEIQISETCMNLLGLNHLLGAELQWFILKSPLLSAGAKIWEFPFHAYESSYRFHLDVFTQMGERGLRRGIQGLCTDSDLEDASRKGSLVSKESLVQTPLRGKRKVLFDSVLFWLSAGVRCNDRDEGKTCHCMFFFLIIPDGKLEWWISFSTD